MSRRNAGLVLFGMVLVCLLAATVEADDALMLPRGVARIKVFGTVGSADGSYDHDGTRLSYGDQNLEALSTLGIPESLPDVYHVHTDGAFEFRKSDLYLEYGLTDDFGFGLWTQYWDADYKGTATLERLAGWDLLPSLQQAALNGVVDLLDATDKSVSGLADTVVGFKHRLLGANDSRNRFAYYLGVRFPTGHIADPLDPKDLSLSDEQTDVGLWVSYDYQPTERFFVNVHGRLEYQFEGTRDVLHPLDPKRKIRQDFRPGWYRHLEMTTSYQIPTDAVTWDLRCNLYYYWEGKEQRQAFDAATDRFAGGLSAISGTSSSELSVKPEISLNFLDAGYPVILYFGYGKSLTGTNVAAADYVQFRMDVLFKVK